MIEVEGHTDNVPISTAKYKDNNVLSMFTNEIAYKKQSLSLAAYEIGQKVEGKVGKCFQRIYERK